MLRPNQVKVMNRFATYVLLLCLAPGFRAVAQGSATAPSPAPAAVAATGSQSPASDAAPQRPQEPLPAPHQLSVADTGPLQRAPLDRLRFQWSTVPGAIAYGVEIDCYGCCAKKHWCSATNYGTEVEWMVRTNPYPHIFPSGRPGSWRVWAIDKGGRSGKVSTWSVFSFAAVDPKTSLPPPPATPAPPRALPFPIVMPSARPVDPTTGEACTWPATNPTGPGITVPRGIYIPDPDYGESSRRWRINGGATVIAEIGTDGRVKRACLLDAVQPDLGEQAVKTIKTWRFQPASKDGEAIPYTVSIETDFKMFPWPNR